MTLAQGITGISTPGRFTNPATLVSDLLSQGLLYAIVLAGLYFLARLIISGFSFLTSGGDPAKVQSATREINHALIGLIIIISAFFLGQIIETIFGIDFI